LKEVDKHLIVSIGASVEGLGQKVVRLVDLEVYDQSLQGAVDVQAPKGIDFDYVVQVRRDILLFSLIEDRVHCAICSGEIAELVTEGPEAG